MFLDDLPKQMEAIHAAIEKAQGQELERLAHRLKGSVGNFAAKPALEAASNLELVARQGDFSQVPPAMNVLEHEIRRLQAALEEWARRPSPTEGSALPLTSPPPLDAPRPGLLLDCG